MIFDNYDNLSPNYIPNNMFPQPEVKTFTIENNNFKELKDINGNIIGYEWIYGDTGVIPINPNITIKIHPMDFVSNTSGEIPSPYFTRGEVGDRFYNLVDIKSYYLSSIISRDLYILLDSEPSDFSTSYYFYYKKVNNEYVALEKAETFSLNTYYRKDITYIWIQDESFTFFSDGEKPVTLNPDLTSFNVIAEITNFRHEQLSDFNVTFNVSGVCNYNITLEKSKKLLPGIFYLNAYLQSDTEQSKIVTYELHIK